MRVSNINLTNTPRGYNIKVKNERKRYDVLKIGQAYQVNIMKQYNVTGMHCAACSARVEKAVSKVEGVTSCSVSLLTNSLGVEGDVSDKEIIKAIKKAGYGASVKKKDKSEKAVEEIDDSLEDQDTPVKEKINMVFILFNYFNVFFNGSHDVELATAFVL